MQKHKMTRCQQAVYETIMNSFVSADPVITIVNAYPGAGLSTLMENILRAHSKCILNLAARPALTGMNLLETFYYELGLGAEGIYHGAPIPSYVTELVSIQSISVIAIDDLDDFALTVSMKKTTVSHLSKMAVALPSISFLMSQSPLRGKAECVIHQREITGSQNRTESILQSFECKQQYMDYFEDFVEDTGLSAVTNSVLSDLYARTEGNLASTILNLCHPLLRAQWFVGSSKDE
ncbi:hypothetical protein FX984_00382 [Pseudomonas marginalis]|nr:hypothetical protein FX984_00382 [Pseudomonas marginalis]